MAPETEGGIRTKVVPMARFTGQHKVQARGAPDEKVPETQARNRATCTENTTDICQETQQLNDGIYNKGKRSNTKGISNSQLHDPSGDGIQLATMN